MARRALLVGAATGGLTGVEADLDIMTGVLDRRGFEVRRCSGPRATRAGILAGFRRLTDQTATDDSAVFYYSGHGDRILPAPARAPGGSERTYQTLVPMDYDESTPEDFRGILAEELSVELARLTARTRNVAVLLDCCHAAHLVRDPDLAPRARLRPSTLDLDRHLARLREAGIATGRPHPLGNPYAVRLVACAPWESAYEYTNPAGVRCGVVTDTFRVALDDADGLPVTWSAVVRHVRHRVSALSPGQRPEVEGPARRVLFEVREVDGSGVLPVVQVARNGRIVLRGGRLLGVNVGDEFAVMPAGSVEVDETVMVGVAAVTSVSGLSVQAQVTLRPGTAEVPPNAQAHPLRTAGPTHPVAVSGIGPAAERFRSAISGAPLIRPAVDDEPGAVAEVVVSGDEVVVRDRGGLFVPSRRADDDGIRSTVADVTRLARAAAVRSLDGGPDSAELRDHVRVEWGRVVAGSALPLPLAGHLLGADEPVYVRLSNTGGETVYVSVFDVGVSGRITLLTTLDPSGVRLPPGEEHLLGAGADGEMVGLSVTWPEGLPADGPRPESLLAIVTRTPEDLGVLEQDGVGVTRGDPVDPGGSPLAQLLDQTVTGRRREIAPHSRAAIRYGVHHVDFLLFPGEPPAAGSARFAIDERPDPSVRALATRGGPARTTGTVLGVRLGELVVHRNRALVNGDVRVDAVVITAQSQDSSAPVHRAVTSRFPRIRDGERLPLEDLLVYFGPAVGFLDFAVWVSRERSDSPQLSELLRHELGTGAVTAAVGQLASLPPAAPQGVAVAGALSASAGVVDVCARLLSGALGTSIGVYRTSLLAVEDFGIGRHPANGLLRSQDFSFRYEIVPGT